MEILRFLTLFIIAVSTAAVSQPAEYESIFSFAITNSVGVKGTGVLIEGSDRALYGMAHGGGVTGNGTIFRIVTETATYTILHSFGVDKDGADPVGGLLRSTEGDLFGVTTKGGLFGIGTLFKIHENGGSYEIIHSFAPEAEGVFGSEPLGSMIQGSDNQLYGVTQVGGLFGAGTVFTINKDGSGYKIIHTFTGDPADGASPASPLIEGSDGVLYGVTAFTVFRTSRDGNEHRVLHTFPSSGVEGLYANALIQASDGFLYGTTTRNANYQQAGTIFKLRPDGNAFQILRELSYADGIEPSGGLVEAPQGDLWGMSRWGGPCDGGSVFRISKDGTSYSPGLVFCDSHPDLGCYPIGGLLLASDGEFYGATTKGTDAGRGGVFTTRSSAGYPGVLLSFVPTDFNGSNPGASLMQASDGRLYGSTTSGGSNQLGVIFSLEPNGEDFQVLRHTTTYTSSNGLYYQAPLIEGNDGRLYGTSAGVRPFLGPYTGGIIFAMGKQGDRFQILWRFAGAPSDGEHSDSQLVQTKDGWLFGATRSGGSYTNGTLFKIRTDGSGYAQVHWFTGTNGDGAHPSSLLLASDGALYGITADGGAFNMGTLFRLRADGFGYAILAHFSDMPHPSCLVETGDGTLFGTTGSFASGDAGSVFSCKKDGTSLTVVRRFLADGSEGWGPIPPFLEGADGVLYGTTSRGGACGGGTVFRLLKDGGAFHVLANLPSLAVFPVGVVETRDGYLCGISYEPEDFGYGTIFRLKPPIVLANVLCQENSFSFQFNARSDRLYIPQFKNSVGDPLWISLPPISNAQGIVTFADTNLSRGTRFYRIGSQ